MARARIRGFTDIGPPRVPPLPQYTILTDRADGTLWALVHNGDSFGIDDTVHIKRTDKVEFGAFHGPRLASNPKVRLLVRNGFLGYEDVTLPVGESELNTQRPLTRRGVDRKTFEVIEPSTSFVLGRDALAYDEVVF